MQENYRNYGTFEEEYATVRGMNAFISRFSAGCLLDFAYWELHYVSTNVSHNTCIKQFLFFGLLIGELVLVAVLSAVLLSLNTALH